MSWGSSFWKVLDELNFPTQSKIRVFSEALDEFRFPTESRRTVCELEIAFSEVYR